MHPGWILPWHATLPRPCGTHVWQVPLLSQCFDAHQPYFSSVLVSTQPCARRPQHPLCSSALAVREGRWFFQVGLVLAVTSCDSVVSFTPLLFRMTAASEAALRLQQLSAQSPSTGPGTPGALIELVECHCFPSLLLQVVLLSLQLDHLNDDPAVVSPLRNKVCW